MVVARSAPRPRPARPPRLELARADPPARRLSRHRGRRLRGGDPSLRRPRSPRSAGHLDHAGDDRRLRRAAPARVRALVRGVAGREPRGRALRSLARRGVLRRVDVRRPARRVEGRVRARGEVARRARRRPGGLPGADRAPRVARRERDHAGAVPRARRGGARCADLALAGGSSRPTPPPAREAATSGSRGARPRTRASSSAGPRPVRRARHRRSRPGRRAEPCRRPSSSRRPRSSRG